MGRFGWSCWFAVALFVVFACTRSNGACVTNTGICSYDNCKNGGGSGRTPQCMQTPRGLLCGNYYSDGTLYYSVPGVVGAFGSGTCTGYNWSSYYVRYNAFSCTYTACDTEEEYNLYRCEQNPNLEGCIPPCTEKDSTWIDCKTTFRWYIGQNREIAVSSVTTTERKDCETTQSVETYENKTCDELFMPDSSELKCAGSFGEYVTLENGKGQQWRCKADGECAVALAKYGLGECASPFVKSSSSASPSSSSGEIYSSSEIEMSSSSAETDSVENPNNGISPQDLEFVKDSFYMVDTNFQAVRENQISIGAGVNNIGTKTEQLLNNSYDIKDLLGQINNKDFSPNINVGSPDVNVNVEGDTIILNLPDTTAPTSSETGIPDSMKIYLEQTWEYAKSAFLGFNNWDSTRSDGGYLTDKQKDDLDNELKDKIKSLVSGDSGGLGDFKDSAFAIINKLDIMNLPQGSGGCPAVLEADVVFDLPLVGSVSAPPIGQYICTPLSFLNVSIWQLAKTFVRLVVSILCMFFLFKCATGTLKEG